MNIDYHGTNLYKSISRTFAQLQERPGGGGTLYIVIVKTTTLLTVIVITIKIVIIISNLILIKIINKINNSVKIITAYDKIEYKNCKKKKSVS